MEMFHKIIASTRARIYRRKAVGYLVVSVIKIRLVQGDKVLFYRAFLQRSITKIFNGGSIFAGLGYVAPNRDALIRACLQELSDIQHKDRREIAT